ncbi:TetR family transcriptional regulator [Mycobacterium sp. IEC1808]|uniref:TetR/AcrR family transcriptional regulator n=1 Tax=Mycobacterium sp. IEC1808 TaxID=1743230 RepID=UPI000A15E5F9|nr:TetR/AcrR family transcriptional regulator [Mycobacterium sp. IEC1808]ORW87496.1 TetR family transcriptional regulator [Mycobacterium sp. IEC1808]
MTTPAASPDENTESVPTGRDEVIPAILESAADLFAERGPAAASIRDVAARAKVNHGLVFRHFGNKEQLVAAVLNHQAANLSKLIDAGAELPEIATAGTRQLRVLSRALLDGYPVAELQTSFPAAVRLLDEVRPQHDSEDAARLATGHAVALLLGWQLFEPFIRSAIGLHELPEDALRQSIFTEMGTLSLPH